LSLATTSLQLAFSVYAGLAFFTVTSLIQPLASLLWTVAIAWLLLGRRAATVTTPEYRQMVDMAEKPSAWRTPFLIVPVVVVVGMALFITFAVLTVAHME
jgi:hypothetical protein